MSFGAQENKLPEKEIVKKIEVFILEQKLDSAAIFLPQLESNDYNSILSKIVNKEFISYEDLYRFTSSTTNKQSIKYLKVSNYINEFIEEPTEKKINLDYVKIKWGQVSELRNRIGLEEASFEQEKLESYIEKFNIKDVDVLRAKTRITTHPIVMFLIQKDIENGKKLTLESLDIAKKIDDKPLQVAFLYHLTDFLMLENKLQEYIDASEESLRIENELERKSPYYNSTIDHLIDAYIYKGGNNVRVKSLLDEMYQGDWSKLHSYYLYAKFVNKLKTDSPQMKEVLNKFDVNNTLELVEKFRALGKDLNHHDFANLIAASSNALVSHGFYKEGVEYKNIQINLIKDIYSKDLSESLAEYKTAQALKGKQQEIEHEKERTTLYGIIALLAFVLFFIALLVLRKIKKQSKQLTEKNSLIRKALKEKELLVKEVHHRVKNNFQIVSSLLELQSRGIEDEKALELANEGKNRVKSMALIHQKLYQNETGLVDFDEYIHLLVKELSSLFKSDNIIDTSIKSENMSFDVDTAIPLGLIINEVITNSYKYAFNKDKENTLSISINKENDENFKLIIEDNGPGLSDDIDIKKTRSLGLRLVNRLVKQLHGKLNLTNDNGARFEILFKDIHTRQLVD